MSNGSGFQRFLVELRRRHVPQTAAVYLVAAWAAIEFADVVVPNLNGPQWVVKAVIIAAIVGFPAVLVLAWIFDWGPEGLERTSHPSRTGVGDTGGGVPAPATSAPWMAAVAVLVVGIASALAVAAVLVGGDESDAGDPADADVAEAPRGGAEGGEGVPREPPAPPVMVAPGMDSIQREVLRGLGDIESLAELRGLGALGARLGGLDSAGLEDFVDVAREMAGEAGLQILLRRPNEWRLNRDVPVALAEGDSLAIDGVAHDTAGVVFVRVDGETVAESDEPDPVLPFHTTLVGAGDRGQRTVEIVIRTADGREVREEYRIVQVPERP